MFTHNIDAHLGDQIGSSDWCSKDLEHFYTLNASGVEGLLTLLGESCRVLPQKLRLARVDPKTSLARQVVKDVIGSNYTEWAAHKVHVVSDGDGLYEVLGLLGDATVDSIESVLVQMVCHK
jgi:hypothetical protein